MASSNTPQDYNHDHDNHHDNDHDDVPMDQTTAAAGAAGPQPPPGMEDAGAAGAAEAAGAVEAAGARSRATSRVSELGGEVDDGRDARVFESPAGPASSLGPHPHRAPSRAPIGPPPKRVGTSIPLDNLLTTPTQAARPVGRGRSSGTTPTRAQAPLVYDMSSPTQPDNEVVQLKAQVQALQAMLDAVSRNMERMAQSMQELKSDGGKSEDKEPYMNIKDVEKPAKYAGDISKWALWENDFTNFLARRDWRWKAVLRMIKVRSEGPLTDAKIIQAREDNDVAHFLYKDEVFEAFQDQLYEYLKAHTAGDVRRPYHGDGEWCGEVLGVLAPSMRPRPE